MPLVRLLCVVWFCLCAAVLRADSLEELVQLHREALGGASRLGALVAMRAQGRVVTGGQTLEFELLAQRPNRVRITMRGGGRTLVQGCDGANPPWRWEPGKAQPAAPMKAAEGREFAADAEFDDPLASSPDRGYRLDFAGRVAWRDQQVVKILVTRSDMAPTFLLVDPDTFFIVARLTTRRLPSGRELTVETRYDRYRPVAGVILPHRVETFVDGQRTGELVLTTVQSIAPPPSETFAVPGES
jgi:hypothetical protein